MSSPDKVAEAADRLGSMAMTKSDAEQTKQCASCGKAGDALKRCTACKSVWYCGVSCQIDHRKAHKKECKRIKKELEASCGTDAVGASAANKQEAPLGLFDEPPPRPICDICMLMLPIKAKMMMYASCCGKRICGGCSHAQQEATNKINEGKAEEELLIEHCCPFCRAPLPGPNEDHIFLERWKERIELKDPVAMRKLAHSYIDGDLGLPVDHVKAVELTHRAADFGSAEAPEDLGCWYYNGGMGLEQDSAKARLYFELAAKRGNITARHNLGSFEHNIREDSMHNPSERRRREELAVAHWRMSAAAGSKMSMEWLMKYVKLDIISLAEYEEIERAHNEICEEMQSEERDRFIEYTKREGTLK